MSIYLYDDPADTPLFLPFTQSRPIGELRHGAHLLRERIARAFGDVAAHVCDGAHLAAFTEPGATKVVAAPEKGQRRMLLRSTFVPGHPPQDIAGFGGRGVAGLRLLDDAGATVGALLEPDTSWAGPSGIRPDWPTVTLRGGRVTGAWELVGKLLPVLTADLAAEQARRAATKIPAGCTVLGDPAGVMIDDGAIVEPLVVFDTRGGPVWIRAGAEIRTFSRLAGPLVVGEGTRVVGGQLRESSIGPMCVVHGEVSNSLFLGYANKSHDGFLGHSVVGRWANLGAGTITSNLKNTYGPIRLTLGDARIDTGLTFLGALIGDHVKTAIGTMLSTGSVIGTGANLFGSRRPDASVRAFAWGTEEPDRVMACRMFLQTAGRVLPRRKVELDEPTRAWLTAVWEAANGQPCD